MGFKLDAEGIHPTNEKYQAIQNAPAPNNKEELQSFLGMINFYNRFLEGKATVAEKLHRLLDVNAKWKWTSQEESTFQRLKGLLQSDAVLTSYSIDKELILACDASSYGVGAVLAHRDKDGLERPIAYASRTLGASERNYAQLDREALSILFGITHFHLYVAGRSVTIITDHKPLLGILQPNKQIPDVVSPRLLRWCLILAGYSYKLEYRPGKLHSNADCLSRLPLKDVIDEPAPPGDILLLEAFDNQPVKAEEIQSATQKDVVLSRVCLWVLHGWPTEKITDESFHPYMHRRNELSIHKGCILWGSHVVIPPDRRQQVISLLHANHPGMTAMKAYARSYIWWPKMDGEIETCVKHCHTCQIHRNNPKVAPRQIIPATENPWSKLHIDFAGPYKSKIFLMVVDSMSKWLEVEIVKTTSSAEVIRCLRKLFATHGLCDTIISDNGAAFVSQEIRSFYQSNGIKYNTSAPYHPSSNGQAERMVQYTKQVLATLEEGDISLKLARFLFRQHTTPHATTNKTPAELLMGRRLRTALDLFHPDNIQKSHEHQSDCNANPRSLKINDKVYIRNYQSGDKWIPAKIIEITGPVSYIAETLDGNIARRHIDQIRQREVEDSTCYNQPQSDGATNLNYQPEPLDIRKDPMIKEEGNSEVEDLMEPPPGDPLLPTAAPSPQSEIRRSGRLRKRPTFLDDYVQS